MKVDLSPEILEIIGTLTKSDPNAKVGASEVRGELY